MATHRSISRIAKSTTAVTPLSNLFRYFAKRGIQWSRPLLILFVGVLACQPFSHLAAMTPAALKDVRGLIYSTTAAELQWTRTAPARVEVRYNGQVLGRFDSNSLFRGELDPALEHRFELRTLGEFDALSAPVSLTFTTGDFTPPIRQVQPSHVSTPAADSPVVESPVAQQPAVESPVVEAPPSQPVDQPRDDAINRQPADLPTTVLMENSILPGDCVVYSLSQLSACVQTYAAYSRISIQSDLSCSGAACCPAGGALLSLDNMDTLTIAGNGYKLLRTSGHRQCSLMDIRRSRLLRIENWQLDDDSRVAACVVNDRCPRMLHIRNSNDITLDRVAVSHSKGYAIYVQEVDGFTFVDSSLKRSGVLGLYIGHSGRASTRVRVSRSTFMDNQTNALALLGVRGSSLDSNIISGNIFLRNHYRGQWPVEPRFGTGFTGGGQMYIAEASGLTIRENVIADGYCENCFVQRRFGSGVSGIELAIPGRNSVSNTIISRNIVANHDAWGIFVNQGSTLDGSVSVTDNQLLNNTAGLKTGAAAAYGNLVQDR